MLGPGSEHPRVIHRRTILLEMDVSFTFGSLWDVGVDVGVDVDVDVDVGG